MKLQHNTTSNRLGGYLTAAVTCSTIASTASAAIVTFADSGSFIEGTVDNGDQATITIALPGGENLFIDAFSSSYWLDLTFDTNFNAPNNGRFTGSGTRFVGFNYPGVDLLSFGSPIFANNSGDRPFVGSLVSYYTPQPALVGNVEGYIGFITPLGNKGWLDVAYNSSTGLFQYNGGAVATAGEDLLAGTTIPEPSTAVLSLGALAAGALIRRRKQVA